MGRPDIHKGQALARRATALTVLILICWLPAVSQAVTSGAVASVSDVRALLIGSHSGGPTHWITTEAFRIENVLEFNGIPYDFFDIQTDELTQATLDSYSGIILDGYAMHWNATDAERQLIANSMETGSAAVLLAVIHGQYTQLNGTIYGAMDVSVDGLGNNEVNIGLFEGAINAYDYPGEDGFIVTGGPCGKHLGIAVNSLGTWSCVGGTSSVDRSYGLELALETWMENAFGIDARVTMPVISLRLDDTQTTSGERHQEVIDFIDASKHRIRASGFLVTGRSAYMFDDTTLHSDEEIISRWGSMSLHGKDHGTVGAEGENRDYETQYSDMNEAVGFLVQHFPRYKPMKASPDNSWNEATLHAMYENGIYYHSASYRKSDDYEALYESVFDADTDMKRQKIKARARAGNLTYYPLTHTDETGVAEIYSVDWGPLISGTMAAFQVLPALRSRGLDWWTPVCVGSHFYLPGFGGANNNPLGWTLVIEELMEMVDRDSYCWRRWVDTYDFANYVERFERCLTVNSISASSDMITYNLTATQPIRFMTLKTYRTGRRIASVTIDGEAYAYFGDDYVHLSEIYGNTVVCVALTSLDDISPHVTHIDPSGVIEGARYTDGKIRLSVSGEFVVTAHLAASSGIFRHGTTRVYCDTTLDLEIDVSTLDQTDQIEMSVYPAAGMVDVNVEAWDVCGAGYRKWTESAGGPGIGIDHSIGDLEPNLHYLVRIEGTVPDTCMSDIEGRIRFTSLSADSAQALEVVPAGWAGVEGSDSDSSRSGDYAPGFVGAVSPVPVGAAARIGYRMPEPGHVTLSLYSAGGRHVATLVDGMEVEGVHHVEWNGCDKYGRTVSSGVYFCRLKTHHHKDLRKIIVIH